MCISCARDLAVPLASERPVITSFSPLVAFSDAELTIVGKNFDPVAANNIVQFAATTARADHFDANGNLVVLVPEASFTELGGTISVSNKNGASDQSAEQFQYLGRGHPFIGSIVGTTQFRHRPAGIAVVGSEVLIASTVAWAVMGSAGTMVTLSARPSALVNLPDASAAFVAAGGVVMRIGGASVDLSPAKVAFLAASPDSTHLVAFAVDPLGRIHVVALSPANLGVVATATLPGTAIIGAAALDDGRAVLAEAGQVTLVDPSAPAGAQKIAAPSPLAGAIVATKTGLAAAFADGSVRVLSSGAWGSAVAASGSEPFSALTAKGLMVVGTKPLDKTVRTFAADGSVTETAYGFDGTPGAATWSGTSVAVADDQSNTVQVIDTVTGSNLPRLRFPLHLGGTLGCGQGSAVEEDPRPQHYRYQFLSVARATNQLFAIDYNQLTVQAPMPLAAGSSPVRGVVMPGPQGVWIVHDVEIGKMRDDDTEEILTTALPGTKCVLFADAAGSALVVLRSGGVSVLRGKEVTATVQLPFDVLSGYVRADGKFVLFLGDAASPGASPRARLYSLDALEHGGGPELEFGGTSRYQGFLGAFGTYFGPMLFFTWDTQTAQYGAFAVVLDAQFQAQPAVNSLVPEPGVVRMTPDGSYIVWRRQGENVLQVLNAGDLGAIYGYEAYALDGAPAAPSFDSSGQYMYVPEPELDEIQTFQ